MPEFHSASILTHEEISLVTVDNQLQDFQLVLQGKLLFPDILLPTNISVSIVQRNLY